MAQLDSYAIVLGAGGVAGWGIHFGACAALSDVDLGPAGARVVVGTSAGAAVAASHLGGVDAAAALAGVLRPPTAEQRREHLARMRAHNRRRSWLPTSPGLVSALLPGRGGVGVTWAGLAPAGAFPGDSLATFPGVDHDGWPTNLRVAVGAAAVLPRRDR